MTARRACVLVTSHAPTTVTTLGLASMLAFVGPLGACASGATDERTALSVSAIALVAFVVIWAVASAGVPDESPAARAAAPPSARERVRLVRAYTRLVRAHRDAARITRRGRDPFGTKARVCASAR